MRLIFFCLHFVLLLCCAHAARAADEPAYCRPEVFLAQEVTPEKGKADLLPNRLRAFRLGKTLLVGASVFMSDAMGELAKANSTAGPDAGFCTWYLNKGRPYSQMDFNWRYVENPKRMSAHSAKDWMEELSSSFGTDPVSFVSCAERHGYIAGGCNSQSHRGPTLFGMILAYSGCSPENAAQITNSLWGLNSVSEEVRLAIIRAAYELGAAEPAYRKRLAAAFGAATVETPPQSRPESQ